MENTIDLKNLNILEIFGALSIILYFFYLLFKVVPQFKKFKNFILNYLASIIKNKKLEKQAIASNIEKVVNNVVIDVQSELPLGWIRKVSIKWVSKELPTKLEEDQMIIKLKPLENQDYNLLNGVFHCFQNLLFPETKDVIPKNIRNSVVLFLSKRTITKQHPYLKDKFETGFVEPSIKSDDTIADFYGKFEELDKEGYFTGTFIREIYHVSKLVRYNQNRKHIEDEIKAILEHIREFQNKPSDRSGNIWYRKGLVSSYGFILVAKHWHPGVKPYVKRAKERIEKGISRLYILGCNQEKRFVKKVIKSIANLSEYQLIELYKLNKDYRGENDGIGALLIVGFSNEDTEREIGNFFEGI